MRVASSRRNRLLARPVDNGNERQAHVICRHKPNEVHDIGGTLHDVTQAWAQRTDNFSGLRSSRNAHAFEKIIGDAKRRTDWPCRLLKDQRRAVNVVMILSKAFSKRQISRHHTVGKGEGSEGSKALRLSGGTRLQGGKSSGRALLDRAGPSRAR